MARPLRIQYEGAVYHVTCRGNEKKEIYKDDNDRKAFLEILEDSINTYKVILYSYVLMENHFHLLIETPLSNLSEFMRRFNIAYTSYYNRRHKRTGHLYQGRYKSMLVDKESYLTILSRYIHLNPVRIKSMEALPKTKKAEYLKEYRWSSLLGYIGKDKSESFLDYGMVLEGYGGENKRGRDNYWRSLYEDLYKGIEIKDKVIGQSILGSDSFVEGLKEKFRGTRMREVPSAKKLLSYRAKEEIIGVIESETGKGFEEVIRERGSLRQVAMELLYRVGGIKGVEIGEMMGVDYSTVSQGRKRLREKLKKDKELTLTKLIERIENKLSI